MNISVQKVGVFVAKRMYKIPYGLNATYGDMEISFQGKNGVGSKPIPVKVVLGWLCSALLCFIAVSKTIVSSGTFLQIAMFVILWFGFTFVLLKYDPTQRLQASLVPTLMNYVRKSDRLVLTRSSSNAIPFYNIAGIKSIDERTGLVEYIDGTYAYWYRVVGSASILLFDADRQAILDRVDNFYRKLNTDCEVLFMTTKSSQQVYKQIMNLKRKYDRLEVRDPELLEVANAEFRTLRDYVGSSFKCIHQYMVIKADNFEMLQQTKNILASEVENSTLMIKRCMPMYYDDILATLELVYKGKGG